MSKKGENIYKRKDGRWEGRYVKSRIGGKIQYGYVYTNSYRQTKDKLTSLTQNGTAAAAPPYTGDTYISFGTAAEEWYKARTKYLRASSLAKYRNILNKHLLPEFGLSDISSITHKTADSFCTKLLTGSDNTIPALSPATVSSILTVLKSILKFSSDRFNITIHSLNSVYIKQYPKTPPVLSHTQQKKLISCLISGLNSQSLGIIICLFMGLRIGEICALKWQDVLFDEKVIAVSKTMQRIQIPDESSPHKTQVVISKPKSISSTRKIPIPQSIYPYLKLMKKSDNAYILTSSETRFTEPRCLENKFKQILRSCGIEYVNFHTLRHTFATNCVELGFDVKSLSEILGHSGVNITLNKYVHPSMNLKQKNMNKIKL